MRKSFKKGLAMALAAAMVFSTPVVMDKTVVSAAETPMVVTESTTTEDVVDGGAFWSAWSNYYQMEGNFNAEFTVKSEAKEEVASMANHQTPAFVFTTDADRGADGYREYLLIRSDDFWWGNGGLETNGKFGSNKDDIVQSTTSTIDWNWETDTDAWKTAMKNGTVKVSIKRVGENFTFKEEVTPAGETEAKYHYTVTFTAPADQKIRIFMTAEQNKSTITSYTYQKIEGIADGFLGDNITAELNADGTAIDLKYETKMPVNPANITIKVNDVGVATGAAVSVATASGEAETVSGSAVYAYTPNEDGEIKFTVSVAGQTIDGTPYLAQEKTVTVKVAKVGERYLYDADLYEGFSVEEGSEGYNITWKTLNDATVKVTVAGDGKTTTLSAPGTIKFADIKAGVEYTVTITAEKANYVTKTEQKKFTYSAKFEAYTVGTTDKKTAFWQALSKPYQINDKKTRVIDLEVHGGTNVYNNVVFAFANQEDFNEKTRGSSYVEYAVVRTDLFGWGGGDHKSLSGDAITYVSHSLVSDGKTLKQGDPDFEKAFIALMDSANLTVDISRNGKMLEIDMKAVSTKNANNVFTSKTTVVLGTKDGKDNGTGKVYMRMAVDNSYFIVKNVTEKDYTGQPPIVDPPVSTAKVSKVALKVPNKKSGKTIYMKVKDKLTLKATVTTTGKGSISKKVTWKSSNKKVAAVTSGGKVTAKKAGTAKITATSKADKKKKATITIKVSKKAVKNKALKLKATKKTVKKGKTYTIAIKKITKKTTEKITYKTSKKSVATVDAYGVVKAKKKGKANITVKCGKKKATLKVTVK